MRALIFTYLFFSPNSFPFFPLYNPIPQPRCATHRENPTDVFTCTTRDVYSPIPVKQMSYINLSLRNPCKDREQRKGGEGAGRKIRRNKGINREAFACQTPHATTHTHTHIKNTHSRSVIIVKMWLPLSTTYVFPPILFYIHLPLLLPSHCLQTFSGKQLRKQFEVNLLTLPLRDYPLCFCFQAKRHREGCQMGSL